MRQIQIHVAISPLVFQIHFRAELIILRDVSGSTMRSVASAIVAHFEELSVRRISRYYTLNISQRFRFASTRFSVLLKAHCLHYVVTLMVLW